MRKEHSIVRETWEKLYWTRKRIVWDIYITGVLTIFSIYNRNVDFINKKLIDKYWVGGQQSVRLGFVFLKQVWRDQMLF